MNYCLDFTLLKNTFLFWLVLSMCFMTSAAQVQPAAANTAAYIPKLEGKKIGVVAHQASVFKEYGKQKHLVDLLLECKVNLVEVFAPEHGFRGIADAGEKVADGKDPKTQLPIFSLYGKNRKPAATQLKGIDLMVFDLQDVGVRFFTYLSTLHYVMEACAEQGIPLIVLDRPNPNTHYIDGPVLNLKHQSFVGMHPVPIVYGMTIGEYATMVNNEGWLKNSIYCDLRIIKMKNYSRNMIYDTPLKPSPNLPNRKSINLYPSLCLFEGTNVSIGRGTNQQFQVIGNPSWTNYEYTFTPKSMSGAKFPKHLNTLCYGLDLRDSKKLSKINLEWILEAYKISNEKKTFFKESFDLLAGNYELKQQIIDGKSENQIRESWTKELSDFKKIRSKYLIYN